MLLFRKGYEIESIFIQSFNKHSMNTYHVPGTLPGTENTSANEADQIPVLKEFLF